MEVHYFIEYHGMKIVLIVASLINIVNTYKIITVHACTVVFNGYGNGASAKDHEHPQWNKGMTFPYVKIKLDIVVDNK